MLRSIRDTRCLYYHLTDFLKKIIERRQLGSNIEFLILKLFIKKELRTGISLPGRPYSHCMTSFHRPLKDTL